MAQRTDNAWQDMGDVVRKMPASLTAERAVLGSILLDPASLTDVLAVVRPLVNE